MENFRLTGKFGVPVEKSCRSREIRKGWKNLRSVKGALPSAVNFEERHEIASPRKNIFLCGGPFLTTVPSSSTIMLRTPRLRRQVAQSFVCWRCVAKSQLVGAFSRKSQRRSSIKEPSQRHFSGGRTVSLSTSLCGSS